MPVSAAPSGRMDEVILSAIGAQGFARGAFPFQALIASTAWPANNRAIYQPIYVNRPGTVTKFWCLNGATANANIDIGLYRDDYTLISAIGSTAQSGTNVMQEFDIANFAISQGVYFLGLVLSATTGTIFRQNITIDRLRSVGLTQEALGATALPATATPAANAAACSFCAGIAFRTLIS